MVQFGPYTVDLDNLDKVFFPDAGITKGDVVDYYRDMADVMATHLQDRPLALERFPDGIETDGFFQQDCPDYFPDWIDTVTTQRRDQSETSSPVRHVICATTTCLVYLANQGVITFHGWLARAPKIDRPDKLIFDLDPQGDEFAPVKQAARQVRELMETLGLNPYVMTTGSRGLHVMAPLARDDDFDTVRALASDMASHLVERYPDALTTEQRKAKRKGRVYLDIMRNSYGQTTVVPYTLRAKPGAPVATPLHWDELESGDMDSQSYDLRNIRRRLGQMEDPWAGIACEGRGIDAIRASLDRLRNEA